jgi:hypothetical protein
MRAEAFLIKRLLLYMYVTYNVYDLALLRA